MKDEVVFHPSSFIVHPFNELHHFSIEHLPLVIRRGMAGVRDDKQLRAGDGAVQKLFGREGDGSVPVSCDDQGGAANGAHLLFNVEEPDGADGLPVGLFGILADAVACAFTPEGRSPSLPEPSDGGLDDLRDTTKLCHLRIGPGQNQKTGAH